MRKAKIVHDAYLAAPNGANTVMNALLSNSDMFKENDIELTSLSLDDITPRSFDTNDVPQKYFNLKKRAKDLLVSAAQYSRLAAALIIYLTWMRTAKRIIDIYLKSTPSQDEVAFFHTLLPCYYFLKNKKHNQPTVMVLHTNGDNFKMGRIYYKALKKSFIYKKLLKMEEFTLANADRINFVSESSMKHFLELHPTVDKNKVYFIYNGVPDVEVKKTSKSDITEICCVASITKRKGQKYIIDALKKLVNESKPAVHFTFVGDGDDRAEMEREVREFGLTEYITFAGISNKVNEYLFKSDIFILASDDEGLPMAIIEAMRVSLPIVSTPVGGIPEMVEDKKNGLLIQPNAESVYEFLKNINQYDWEAMGKEARKTYEEKFSIIQMVNGYVKLLSFDN